MSSEHTTAHPAAGPRWWDAFDANVLTLEPGRKFIAFAFRDKRPTWSVSQLAALAGELKRRFGINFPEYSQQLLQITDHEGLGVA